MKCKISVIIATKNEEENIAVCIDSIRRQTYPPLEIIIVDNFSKDKTVEIARTFTRYVFKKGPERSTQRNFGANKASGEYLLFIDADMIVTDHVIESCVKKITSDPKILSLVIPEKSFGTSFWAKCKALERSYYEGIDWIEGARFFNKKTFIKLGGYNDQMISGEDWDIHSRFKAEGKCARINEYILHNEGGLSLLDTVKKKYYYAKNIHLYKNTSHPAQYSQQSSIYKRYMLFFSKPKKLLSNPVIGLGMLSMKFCEYGAGMIGYFQTKK